MNRIKNEVALMFSGGIDSLLSAVLLLENFRRVHLITFNKGYLEFGLKNNQSNIRRLKSIYGADRFTNHIVNIKDLTKTISARSIREDFQHYGIEIAWCVGCRLSMNIGALIYALENDLEAMADGSNREQIPGEENIVATAENFPDVVSLMRSFATRYHVNFLTPVYEFGSRDERRKKLVELGMDIDYLSKDHAKTLKGMITPDIFHRSQPICLSGWIIHWKRNLLGIPVEQDEAKTVEYIRRKQEEVVGRYIQDYFHKRNLAIDDLIKVRGESLKS